MNSNSNAGKFCLPQALAASAALHVLLLAQPQAPGPTPVASPPLAVTLRESRPSADAPPPAARRSAPRAVASAAPGRERGKAAPAEAAEDTEAFAGEADSLRRYRFGLAAAAAKLRRYPPLALERGLGGRVEVRLEIAAGGGALPPRVVASSGSSLLDAAAVDMVAGAALATNVPARLRAAAFAVTLPLEFDPGPR